jgi:hypothetical protein
MNMDLYGYFVYGDDIGVSQFALAHRFAHEAEAQAIATQFPGQVIPTYDVGAEEIVGPWQQMMADPEAPIPQAMSDWLIIHNTNHQAMLALLPANADLVAVDLSLADFRDPEQMYGWMTIHQLMHDWEQQSLGITS